MTKLPFAIDHVRTPPIKCQGIKTKLVPFILGSIKWSSGSSGRWIEPFIGSGVVAFNLVPDSALLADTNEHIIRLYSAVQDGSVNTERLREHLLLEGRLLSKKGVAHYNFVRERFNSEKSPYDFLFLNRSCFNGVMRFNGGGKFNVPFCHKPDRFSTAYISKIVNQVAWIAKQMRGKSWEFRVAGWSATLSECRAIDFIYLDPPYIGRHTDYYNQWTESDAEELARTAQCLPCGYALSMWYENRYRKNQHIEEMWAGNVVRLWRHFYHVGSLESLRNEMFEALVIRPGWEAAEMQVAARTATREGQLSLYR